MPTIGPRPGHPPSIHADLNLAVRGYVPFTAALTLVDINGPIDDDAPRLGTLFADRPLPEFTGAYQVNGWDWSSTLCPDALWAGHGCRAAPIADPPVTLLAMASARGEAVLTPYRRPEIYPAHFVALVLYAEETRLTLGYTRDDSAAAGYVIHLEDVCVDPNLLSLYRSLDAAGRASLPALHSTEQVGVAAEPTIKAAVRDTGSFMDALTQGLVAAAVTAAYPWEPSTPARAQPFMAFNTRSTCSSKSTPSSSINLRFSSRSMASVNLRFSTSS